MSLKCLDCLNFPKEKTETFKHREEKTDTNYAKNIDENNKKDNNVTTEVEIDFDTSLWI